MQGSKPAEPLPAVAEYKLSYIVIWLVDDDDDDDDDDDTRQNALAMQPSCFVLEVHWADTPGPLIRLRMETIPDARSRGNVTE